MGFFAPPHCFFRVATRSFLCFRRLKTAFSEFLHFYFVNVNCQKKVKKICPVSVPFRPFSRLCVLSAEGYAEVRFRGGLTGLSSGAVAVRGRVVPPFPASCFLTLRRRDLMTSFKPFFPSRGRAIVNGLGCRRLPISDK